MGWLDQYVRSLQIQKSLLADNRLSSTQVDHVSFSQQRLEFLKLSIYCSCLVSQDIPELPFFCIDRCHLHHLNNNQVTFAMSLMLTYSGSMASILVRVLSLDDG
jgi:hypothetical protein